MGGQSVFNTSTKEYDWKYEETIQAVAYDIPITGFNTFNTNNLRLWRSRPYFGDQESFEDLDSSNNNSFDSVDLVDTIDKLQDAEYLTSVYYPSIPG